MAVRQIRDLSANEKRSWLRLTRAEGIGPITFYKLLNQYKNADEALNAVENTPNYKKLKLPDWSVIDQELSGLEKLGGKLIAICEPDYPDLLRWVEDAPPLISIRGYPHIWQDRKSVAIIGARNATLNGLKFAGRLAKDLSDSGLCVTSGLARGIDTSAHNAALTGATIGVLASGVDVVYPPENQALYDKMTEQGAIISENPLGFQPQSQSFPKRNRIISGISHATIVVEAALKSGSLITARFAAEQGREVFAVPGSPLDPRAQGCNALIKQGAHLVETAQDVLDVINDLGQLRFEERKRYLERLDLFEDEQESAIMNPTPDPEQVKTQLLNLIGRAPTPIDELVRTCQLSSQCVSAALLELELTGQVKHLPGHKIQRVA